MRILVATDGSKPALHAVKYAVEFQRSLSSSSSSVTLISVTDDVGLRHARAFVGKEVVADYLWALSAKELKPARKLIDSAGVKHDMEVSNGHVAQEMAQCTKAGKFDLTALGAKGRGAMADLLISSVPQRVLATADRPVLLIK